MGTKDRLEIVRAAIRRCDKRRVAVDVGAHAGRWSTILAQNFYSVMAFEPVPENCRAWTERVKAPNATLFERAVGNIDGKCRIEGPGNSKYWRAIPDEAGPVDMMRLDSLRLWDVDLIKTDCEGDDTWALLGAVETIIRCQPVVVVEFVPERDEISPITVMEKLGYQLVETIDVDHVLAPGA